jgi:hypothetical protein
MTRDSGFFEKRLPRRKPDTLVELAESFGVGRDAELL